MGDGSERVWADTMPDAYDRLLGPSVFEPFAVDLARRAAARGPGRVLELAAGSGAVTRELVGAGLEVTATDLNGAMVDHGRTRAPGARWRQADAMALPFDAEAFDAVVCQFGVMFFPDRPAAWAEARRVLRPGGALLANAWDGVETHDFAAAVVAALDQVFPDDPPRFLTAVPHGYADPRRMAADAEAAGFEAVEVERIELVGRAPSAADVAVGFCTGTPLRAEIEARGDLAEVTAAVAEHVEARLGSGPVEGRMAAYVIDATR